MSHFQPPQNAVTATSAAATLRRMNQWVNAIRLLLRGDERVAGGTPSHRHGTSFGAPLGGGSSGGGEWELEDEGRAFPGVRLDPDLPAHPLDEPLADVETEAGPAHALSHLGVEAVELLEDPLLLMRGDSESLVAHAEPHRVVVRLEADFDLTLAGVLDRVLDEVDEHLPQLVRIRGDGRRTVRMLDVDRDLRRKVCARSADDLGDDGERVDARDERVRAVRVQSTHPEDV